MKHFASGLLVTLLLSLPAHAASGSDPELAAARAKVSFLYKRLAGIPAPSADIENWAAQLKAATDKDKVLRDIVAEAALKTDSFYGATVLDFAQIEASEERDLNDTPALAMNDLITTILGYVRDGKDYRAILSGDTMYLPQGMTYNVDNNTAFETFYAGVKGGTIKLSDPAVLVETPQMPTTGLSVAAGILTTRGFGSVFYNDGTNRSPFRSTMVNYLCRDMEDLSDVTRADIYVRRDVERVPGGDAGKYRTECVGCHAGMDAQSKVFAYLDFIPGATATTGKITQTTTPALKMNRNNETFPAGAAVVDDSWINLWTEGTNSGLGWDMTKKSGTGIKAWGESIASTTMFPECMARRVYKTVCLKDNKTVADKAAIKGLADSFANGGFNMKELFRETAVECANKIGM